MSGAPEAAAPEDGDSRFCPACRFYRARDLDIAAMARARAVGFDSRGRCHRHPPPQPTVGETDWCGEFKRGM